MTSTMRFKLGTWVCSQIKKIYEQLDSEANVFADLSHLACPQYCGKCCYIPDAEVSPPEAEYIANYIIREKPWLQRLLKERLNQDNTPEECAFFNASNAKHCRIYPARPAICRCYGYSAFRDKQGSVYFPACQYMDLPTGLRGDGAVVRLLFKPYPPILEDIMRDLQSIDAIDSKKALQPLESSVLSALRTKKPTQ